MVQTVRPQFLTAGMDGSVLITGTNATSSRFWEAVEVRDLKLDEDRKLIWRFLDSRIDESQNEVSEIDNRLNDLEHHALAVIQGGS